MLPTRQIGALGVLLVLLVYGPTITPAQDVQSTSVAPNSERTPSLQQRYPRYKLHPGDSFDLTFQFSPEFNQTVIVQPDGFISLREMGGLHVAGLTLPQVETAVKNKYSSILNKPVVSVTPKDFEKSYFIAMGEVTRPGKYEIRGPITVTEALAIAGGLAPDRAKTSEVVLFRKKGNILEPGQVVNVKKLLKKRDLSEDLYVKPGDLLYVPQNTWSKIHQIVPTPGVGMEAYPGSF